MNQQVTQAAEAIRAAGVSNIDTAVVAGSGLSALAEAVEAPLALPYDSIPGWPVPSVSGHSGTLVLGSVGKSTVAVAAGRVHLYEGYTARDITFGVRVARALGAETLIVTNASGSVNPEYAPGDLVVISDHLFFPGLVGGNPLVGPNDEQAGARFPSMVEAYDPDLRQRAAGAAREEGFVVHVGVYAMVAGPSYETPAEGRMLRSLGADVVGMSTAPEVVVARHSGMRVLGLSLVTNRVVVEESKRPGPSDQSVDDDLHAEVTSVGRQSSARLSRVITEIVRGL